MTTKLSTSNLSAETLAAISGPRISNVQIADSAYNTLDDTAANIGGGYIIINGQSFNSAAQVLIDQTPATTITWVSNTQIRAQVPAASEGTSRSVYVINPDGSLALLVNGLTYSAFPAWSTGSTLTSFEALVPVSIQLSAPSANNYTLAASNTLPSSVTLYANGLIAGTVAANTTTNYNFTVIAKDNENQDTNRNFTLPITKNNEPAWVTAADLGSVGVSVNYSNTLVATDLSNVTYSVAAGSSLPSSLTLTANGLLSGNVSAANTYSFGIVATDTANLSNTRTFTITIAVLADTFFKNTTLLLNGETTVTPFISDASTNSFPLTINGDTKPVLFNPYTPGYYSNYFNGSSYISTPNATNLVLGSSNYTIELWVYPLSSASAKAMISKGSTNSISTEFWSIEFTNTTGGFAFFCGAYNGASSAFLSGTATLNTWTHIAVVRNSLVHTLYVNGVSVSTVTVGSSYTVTSAGSLYLGTGSYDPSNRYFTGYISNARFVLGTAVYTTAFTPSTTPLTAIANTSLLTCQSNRFIDNSTNAFTFGPSGSPQISSVIPFTQNSSYSTYGSTYFDGTGDYLRIPDNAALQFGSGNWTVEFWAYLSTIGTYRSFFSKVNDDGYYNGVCILTNASGDLIITATNNGAAWQLAGATLYAGALTTGRWQHIAIVRNSNTITGYVNGVAGGTPQTLSGTVNDTGASFFIGSSNGVSAGQKMDGYISDFRFVKGTAVYTTAFTPPTSQLTAIANTSLLTCQYNGDATNQGIIDNSNFNNIITRNGNTSQGTFSPYSVTGWSNYFDGTGDYLTPSSNTPMDFGTGNFTIEGWFLTGDKSISGGANRMIIGNSGNSYTMQLYMDSSGFLTFGNTTTTFIRGSTDLANNSWNHFAIVRSGTGSNQIKMYVNGVEVASGTNSINYASGTIFIGAFGASDGFWNGYISNLRIIKGTALYTTTFTPSTTPLTPITNTQLLTCQSNRFIDNSPNSFTLTRTGDVSVQAFGPFGNVPEAVPINYSNYFDGTGDYLSLASTTALNIEAGDFTIEAWINMKVMPTGTSTTGWGSDWNSWFVIYERSNGGTTGWQFRVGATLLTLGGDGDSSICWGTHGMSAGNWYHVAVSRQSDTYKMFVNGVSLSLTTQAASMATAGTYYIGSEDTSGSYFNGHISNLRVIKGTALYTTTFTPSTTPLTAIANTSLLTCQSTRMIDNSTNNFTLTAAGDVKPSIFNPFGYTAQSATSYTPTTHGGSAYFDGTGDYLTAPASTLWNFTGDWTFECWVYPTAITGFHTFLAQWGAPDNKFIWKMNSSGRMYLENLSTALTATSTTIVANQWQHIALTRSSNIIRMFVNGVLDATTATRSGTYYSAGAMKISANDTGANESFIGYMSDMRIINGTSLYTTTFTPPAQILGNYSTNIPAQLLLNFNNGGIIDQHGTNVLETVGNAQLSTAVKKYNSGSIAFDGTGDYLKIPNSQNFNFGSGNFTVEGWVYCINTSSRQDIFTTPANASGFNGLSFAIYNGNFELTMSWTGGWDILFATAGSVSANTWYHFAVVRNGGTVTVYINGTSTYSNSGLSTSSLVFGTDPATISYGRVNQSDARYLYGYIDDLRITKGYARYTSNFTAPTSALLTK